MTHPETVKMFTEGEALARKLSPIMNGETSPTVQYALMYLLTHAFAQDADGNEVLARRLIREACFPFIEQMVEVTCAHVRSNRAHLDLMREDLINRHAKLKEQH